MQPITSVSIPASMSGSRYPCAALRSAVELVSPRSTCSTNAGQAAACSDTAEPIARWYAPVAIVASVPITPTMPFRVARIAARDPGLTTPTTGMSAPAAMSPIAETSIELQAITSSFTPRRDEVLGDLERVPADLLHRLGAVREPRRVPHVEQRTRAAGGR